MKLDAFTRAYVACALWSSTDEDGEPLDSTYGVDDISEQSLTRAVEDCKAFRETYADTLAQAGDDEQNGHDFWLTRNRHGAGFWSRGYTPAVSRALTEAAHVYGNVDLYVGDDGKIYGD